MRLRRLTFVCLLAAATGPALAQTPIDTFEAGVTQVSTTSNGFGSTTAAGILGNFAGGDPTRYYSWATTGPVPLILDNQLMPGRLVLSHAGQPDSAYANLSYVFSVPADFSAYGQVVIQGSGSGTGGVTVALQDADGDVLVDRQQVAAGSFANLSSSIAAMSCLGLGDGRCDLDRISLIEYRVDGFEGRAWRQEIDAVSVTALAGITEPIPEPGTWALMGLGLAVLAMARRRWQQP